MSNAVAMRKPVIILLAVLCSTLCGTAQGTFQNLGFESANVPSIPPGQFGGQVSSLDAIPYWTGRLGTNEVTQILHNNLTLGQVNISILGPYATLGYILEGQYTVVLQPGLGDNENVSASISQTGLVPADAQSLQFRAQLFSTISVSLGGQDLFISPLGTGPNYTLYGANIPFAAAGQVQTLTITALAGPNTANYFDSFLFSSLPVPEPGAAGLFSLGMLLLGSRTWRRH